MLSNNNDQNEGVEKEPLKMEFDPNTIEDLGVRMYSTLPPVIAELISNSYDAEAESVEIFLYDNADPKRIVVKDDGHGMTYDEINTRFLKIGRKRRKADNRQVSDNEKRLVIGRKGLGKLSFFGITPKSQISTIKDGYKTVFTLDIKEILDSGEKSYEPEIIENEVKTNEENGTAVELLEVSRKTPFNASELALSLSRYFEIFDEEDFKVFIIHNDDEENKIEITNSLKYERFEIEKQWNFPDKEFSFDYEFADKVGGRIVSVEQGETVPSEMNGIALFSRKKLVNKHDFYGLVASSTGYKYLTGWLSVDFIEDFKQDVISTNRQSLNWELEEAQPLKVFLQEAIKKVYNEQRKYRQDVKTEQVKEKLGFDLEEWLKKINSRHERNLAKKLLDSIIQNENISVEKAGELIEYIKDSFQFEAFKDLARDIDGSNFEQTDQILELFREWQIIEAREFQKIARVRVETIQKFEEYIDNNAREVPVLHNFLKEFPWILDPKIMNFRDEVFYSSLLKEEFSEENVELEENRRIDFLCVNFAQTYFIIELKRPETAISHKHLDQCLDYISFLESRLGNENRQKVCCYLVGGRIVDSEPVRKKVEAYRNNNDVIIKPYGEMLEQAKSYHQEFIDRYNELNREN